MATIIADPMELRLSIRKAGCMITAQYSHQFSPSQLHCDRRRAERVPTHCFCMFEAWFCSRTGTGQLLQAHFNADWLILELESNKPPRNKVHKVVASSQKPMARHDIDLDGVRRRPHILQFELKGGSSWSSSGDDTAF